MDCGENTKTKKQLNKKKITKTIVFAFLIILIITFSIVYSNNENFRQLLDKYVFRKEIYEENLVTIQLDNVNSQNVYVYDKYIVVLNENKLKFYNKYGNEEYSLDIEISSPIFDSNGQYLCVSEKDGQKVYLISNKNIIWQKDIEGNIADVSVNKNGYVSIVISGTSYKTIITVCNSKGEELFHKYLSSTNVIDTDISEDNKYLAVAEANFSGIIIQSNVEIISIVEAQNGGPLSIVYTHTAESDDLIINIKYQGKKLVCMYDEHIDVIKDNTNSQIINIKDEDVLFFDIELNSKAVKILKKSTGMFSAEAEIQIMDTNNKNIVTYSIDKIPKQLYISDNMIGVNLGMEALFINSNGWLVKKCETSKEIAEIILGNSIAGIVSKNKIQIIPL